MFNFIKCFSRKRLSFLHKKDALSTVQFMQVGEPSHISNSIKEFLLQTFEKSKVVRSTCVFLGPLGFLICHQHLLDIWISDTPGFTHPICRMLELLELKVAIAKFITPVMYYPLWYWSCRTHITVITIWRH